MKTDVYGQMVYQEPDLIDLVLQGREIPNGLLVDGVNLDSIRNLLDSVPLLESYIDPAMPVEKFDRLQQNRWHMPDEYAAMDIAEYVLNQCSTDAQLQRVGEELLLYQERNLFNLLRYLKYLVDTMKTNRIIWGVGRGSSVASYVLYLLGVHRVDSMYYQLDVKEFLR